MIWNFRTSFFFEKHLNKHSVGDVVYTRVRTELELRFRQKYHEIKNKWYGQNESTNRKT